MDEAGLDCFRVIISILARMFVPDKKVSFEFNSSEKFINVIVLSVDGAEEIGTHNAVLHADPSDSTGKPIFNNHEHVPI